MAAAVAACGGDDDVSDSNGSGASAGAETQRVDLAALPLGDGKISDQPAIDNVFSCQQEFDNSAGGALADGPWIDNENGTWNATEKLAVPGEVDWPSEFEVSVSGDTRTISGNDLPSDPTGTYPIPEDSEAYQYGTNPNSIGAQEFSVDLAAVPELADEASCVSLGAVGMMLNGAFFFNALDGPGRDALPHEDLCDGHPERSGAYHYHSQSSCLEDNEEGEGHSPLVGYAIDGFGIYGHHGENGETLINADLDECHGHSHEIEWDGTQMDLFHYHSTFEYPYTVSCYHGTPSEDQDLGAAAPGGGEADGPPGGDGAGAGPPDGAGAGAGPPDGAPAGGAPPAQG